MKKKAIEFDVSLSPKVIIPRRIELETFLFERQAVKPNRRLSLPDRRHIPFGVRGRKRIRARRLTTSILYVGLQPNLDGLSTPRQYLASRPPIPAPAPAPAQAPAQAPAPAPTPSPPRNVLAATDGEDQLVNFSFNNLFGRMHLSDDE